MSDANCYNQQCPKCDRVISVPKEFGEESQTYFKAKVESHLDTHNEGPFYTVTTIDQENPWGRPKFEVYSELELYGFFAPDVVSFILSGRVMEMSLVLNKTAQVWKYISVERLKEELNA